MSSEVSGTAGLAGRYATALFELADESNALDRTADDLARLQAMIDESADLRRLITSPVIAREDQGRALDALMERAEMSTLIRKFVGLVAGNRRLFALEDMIRAFRAQLAVRRGEVTAAVVSARPLSETQRDRLEASLAATTGAKVSIDASVDASLIGGMVVRIGSRMVDSSLRTKLQKLQFVLKGAA